MRPLTHLAATALLSAAAAALFTVAAAPLFAQATSASQASPARQSFEEARQSIWISEVAQTERGFRIGNPKAGGQLIEFISYTCGHCASFVRESGPTLDLVAVAPGHLAIEVRPVIRNGLDLAITLLARCGGAEKFKDLHAMFLYRQDDWLPKAASAPAAQQAIWMRGDAAGRVNAARALDLDDMVAERGLTMPQINACLSDDAGAKAILAAGAADRAEFNVRGTPTFALNGATLEGVHSWQQLALVLQEQVTTQTSPSADSE